MRARARAHNTGARSRHIDRSLCAGYAPAHASDVRNFRSLLPELAVPLHYLALRIRRRCAAMRRSRLADARKRSDPARRFARGMMMRNYGIFPCGKACEFSRVFPGPTPLTLAPSFLCDRDRVSHARCRLFPSMTTPYACHALRHMRA